MARLLQNWIEEYLRHTEHTEAPERFHFWTAVATIAGALRRKVWLYEYSYTWTPNFFIFFVSPPGIVQKSTTAAIGMKMLGEVEGVFFGPAACTWQSLIKYMANNCYVQFPLDGTKAESILEQEFYPMSAITVVASELGTFLDPRNREQVDALTSLWDAQEGKWEKWTKQDGQEIVDNPWINIIGCTTPSWVAENFTDYFSGGGLASRSVFVYADRKRKLVAYPSEHVPPDYDERRSRLVADLQEIASLVGQFQMTPGARKWGNEWYREHYESRHEHIQSDRFDGYLARKQTHIHKLAMVLSAAEGNSLIIHEGHLIKAQNQMTAIEAKMPLVFKDVNANPIMNHAADMLIYIRQNSPVRYSKAYRNFMRIMDQETFDKLLNSLAAIGAVERISTDNGLILEAKENASQPKRFVDNSA